MTRRLREEWVLQVCPECNGHVEGMTTTHSGDCPNVNRAFVPRSLFVVPKVTDAERQTARRTFGPARSLRT